MAKIWSEKENGREACDTYAKIIGLIDQGYEVHYQPFPSPNHSPSTAQGWTNELKSEYKRPDLEAVWDEGLGVLIWRTKARDNEGHYERLAHIGEWE